MEDAQWELAILATVHGFYRKLMGNHLGADLPLPAGLDAESINNAGWNLAETLSSMRRWLAVLDMAITPAMLRLALTPDTDPEVAEALLRYFARKQSLSDADRDKTDLVATFLYRNPRVPGQWERSGVGLDGSLPLSPFEIAMLEILSESDPPLLPEEHLQVLRSFDSLRQEAAAFDDFHKLIESGIIARVRENKRALSGSFFHPGVLATVATYNCAFGRSFDALYHSAAREIKRFAQTLEQLGGSILGSMDGVDVTVEQVSEFQEDELLQMDYAVALDKFRRVSRLRDELERNPPVRGQDAPAAPSAGRARRMPIPIDVHSRDRAPSPQQLVGEESKLRQVQDSICTFVRVADPRFRQVVPLRFFNLILTPDEVAAACSAHLDEPSPRGECDRTLLRSVALNARIGTELEELKRSQNSATLWSLHADSLAALLNLAARLDTETRAALALGSRFPEESVPALQFSLKKLNDAASQAAHSLTQPAV